MVDPASFRREHPELCPDDLRVPGLPPTPEGKVHEVQDWHEACQGAREAVSWEEAPVVRRLMGEEGAEAFGVYRSFRIDPGRWGLYLRASPLVGLSREIQRILNLGFVEMEDHVPEATQRELAFAMAYDVATNHLAFHGGVDAFAADQEVEDDQSYYAEYLKGPYARTLKEMQGPAGYNLEEVLANVVSLRSFLNPSLAIELGSHLDPHLKDDAKFRWNGYLQSGNLTSELTYVMRAYPESHKHFVEFLRRRGEVGPYAHMAIQYDLNPEAFHKGLRRLAKAVLKGKEVPEPEKALLKPIDSPVRLVTEG